MCGVGDCSEAYPWLSTIRTADRHIYGDVADEGAPHDLLRGGKREGGDLGTSDVEPKGT